MMTRKEFLDNLKINLMKQFHDNFNGSVNISTLIISNTPPKSSLILPQNNPIDLYPNLNTDYKIPEDMNETVAYNFSDIGFNAYKPLALGSSAGLILGLSYGYWDYEDEKRKALKLGQELPNKKKLLIRDTLIGLGLGATVGTALVDKIFKALEDNKANKENKKLYDRLLKDAVLGNDKKKLLTYLNYEGDKLTDNQYNALFSIISSMKDSGYKKQISFYRAPFLKQQKEQKEQDSNIISIFNGIVQKK